MPVTVRSVQATTVDGGGGVRYWGTNYTAGFLERDNLKQLKMRLKAARGRQVPRRYSLRSAIPYNAKARGASATKPGDPVAAPAVVERVPRRNSSSQSLRSPRPAGAARDAPAPPPRALSPRKSTQPRATSSAPSQPVHRPVVTVVTGVDDDDDTGSSSRSRSASSGSAGSHSDGNGSPVGNRSGRSGGPQRQQPPRDCYDYIRRGYPLPMKRLKKKRPSRLPVFGRGTRGLGEHPNGAANGAATTAAAPTTTSTSTSTSTTTNAAAAPGASPYLPSHAKSGVALPSLSSGNPRSRSAAPTPPTTTERYPMSHQPSPRVAHANRGARLATAGNPVRGGNNIYFAIHRIDPKLYYPSGP